MQCFEGWKTVLALQHGSKEPNFSVQSLLPKIK